MQTQIQTTNQRSETTIKRSWLSAYGRFLLSPSESFILKIAPVAFLLGTPELIASEFLPIVGEISDLAALVLIAIVGFRTVQAVKRYR